MSRVLVLPDFGRLVRLSLIAILMGALAMPAGVIAASPVDASHTPYTAAQAKPTLRYGSRGNAVIYVQRKLGVIQTGYFGPLTRAAVNRFKRRHGLVANGVVTRATWGLLLRSTPVRASRSTRSSAGTSSFGQAVVRQAAATARGARYVYGATGPRSFDCSGFVGYVYRKVGKSLPRTSRQMRAATRWIPRSQVRPGDLVFVHTGGRVTHVGIVATNENYWWEASNPRSGVGLHRAWSSRVSYGRVR